MATSPVQPPEGLAGNPQMIQLASVSLPSTSARIKPPTLCYCPTMDLIAAALEDESWGVWRLGGGRVFGGPGFTREKESRSVNTPRIAITTMTWKSLGMLLAIACTDNTLRLVSTYTGKIVHVLSTRPTMPEGQLSCLGWNMNLTDPQGTSQRLESGKVAESLEDILTPGAATSQPGVLAMKADLPRDLALIDVESSFPKLSSLPATGVEDDVFSSRASLDALFHDSNTSPADSVDVLVSGFDTGSVDLKMFESFDIGGIDLTTSFDKAKCKILRHTSQSLSPVHAFVVQTSTGLFLLPMSLRFISASPRYLSIVAAKSTQLQNLLRYIQQTQNQINIEWRTANDLPSKFLRNINESLSEKMDCNFLTAAYHLVVTGDCYAPLKEFLVDELGERGHKRWEKAVASGYETIRRLVHECLLPAIERCQIVTSRLKGLSGFRKAGGILGLDHDMLEGIDDTLDCLNLLAHKLLLVVGKDLRQFTAFAKWLRLEIDIQAADSDASTTDDILDRQDTVEHRLTLDYISGPMANSEVLKYIRPMKEKDQEQSTWEPEGPDSGFYRTFKNKLREDKGQGDHPKLDDLSSYLKKQCDALFAQVADSLRKSIMFSTPIPLVEQISGFIFDIKLLPVRQGRPVSHHSRAVVVAQKGKDIVIQEFPVSTVGSELEGISQAKDVQLDGDFSILDIKFVDTETFMVLRGNNIEARIEAWNYKSMDNLECELRHVFDLLQTKSRPIQLEVNGRKGRRAVCVLFDDRRSYSIFDLDNLVESEDGDDEEDMANENTVGDMMQHN